jgi:CRISPR/Cas system-associated exonuclease Cas4 (RecB family)
LVTPAGIQALTPCSAGWSHVVDFVQKVLHLRFRSAATKLLFNDLFDFADVGPQLAQELAPALRAALAELPDSPQALHIVGLPQRQTWILHHLAASLGLAEWQPDIPSLAQAWKLEIDSGTFESSPAPGALTLLHLGRLLDEQALPTSAQWQLVESAAISGSPDGAPTLSRAASVTTAEPAVATAPVVAVPSVPAADPSPVTTESPAPAKTDEAKAPAAGAEPKQAVPRETVIAPTPPPTSGPAAPSPEKETPSSPAAVVTEICPPVAERVPAPSAPATTPEAAPSPPRAVASSLARYPGTERAPSPRRAGGKVALIAAGFVMLLISVGIAAKFYLAAQQAHAQAESERIAAQARILDMEQQAKIAAERLQQEAVAAREFAVASTRQQLEEEARQQLAAERLAHAPGTLVLTTEPVGALVSIDGSRAQPTPLRRDDLRPGEREITITLPGYEPAVRTVTIQGTRTTDLGRIALVRQVGHLAITTDLPDLRYELRSNLSDLVLQAGSAPANLTDLPTGEYDLVISRAGWSEVRESVQIEREAETVFTPRFSRGRVEVSSLPLGAEIWQDDRLLGHTPLVLQDVAPGALDVVLRLDGHDESRLRGAITAGATLALNAELERLDRVLGLQELATPPVALTKVAPEFDRAATLRQARVLLSFVVDRDGVPGSVRVEHSSHSAAVEPCVKAILQWRFSPGLTLDGRPANARVQQLFSLNVEPALR